MTTPTEARAALRVIMANTGWTDEHACVDAAVAGLQHAGHQNPRAAVEKAWRDHFAIMEAN